MNLETDNKIQKKGITLVIPNPCGNIAGNKDEKQRRRMDRRDFWRVKDEKRNKYHNIQKDLKHN